MVNTGAVPAAQIVPLLTDEGVTAELLDGGLVTCGQLNSVWSVPCPAGPGSGEPGQAGPIVTAVHIRTDGSLASENRIRTQVANVLPNAIVNTSRDPVGDVILSDLGRLGSVAGLFVLIIGAFGLAAATAGGLIERRRPFALLRASGVHLSELRRSVLLETTATMVLTSVVGAAVGMLLAYGVAAQATVDWRWPGLDVLAYLGGGVLAAVLFSLLALPLLGAATRQETIRFE
jgi:predicted lysophospholipase L1 biosynthesis ABC-type transport system permease subunit